MLRKRSRLIAAPIAAVALSLTIAGYQASAAGSSSDGAERSAKVTRAADAGPCLADATTLMGDLDGDGNADKIRNPGHTGAKMTIQWGAEDGTFGAKQAVSKLLGAKRGEIATAAVADFQNDGTLDMVVNIVKPSGMDDPSSARLSEYRPGPLSRSDLGSDDSRHADIGDRGEAQQLRIANYGDDPYPDLAILKNAGDGQMAREVRLSTAGSGPGEYDDAMIEKYGAYGSTSEPPAMPGDGWKHFYQTCS